jgi:phytanoyl-CoA hydroxylase
VQNISDEQLAAALAQYRAEGYARLGPVVDEPTLEGLRARAVELMLGQVSYPGMFFQIDSSTGEYRDAPLGLGWVGPSLNYRKLEKLELDERFRALIRNPVFERLARGVIPGAITLYRALIFNKSAAGSSAIPWHQDGGKLWGLTAEPALQLWVALDDATEGGGCLEVLPGSHLHGLATPLGGLVPVEQVAAAGADARAVPLPARAGEVILVHPHVWHRSGRSRQGARRMGFSVCFMSEDVRCVRKKKAPRQFFKVFP